MKNETLYATISLNCARCRTVARKERLLLYSEKIGHIHCSQCGYQVLEIIFRFEKTNLGLAIEHHPTWKEFYDPLVLLSPYDTLTLTFRSGTGEVIIAIDGNQ